MKPGQQTPANTRIRTDVVSTSAVRWVDVVKLGFALDGMRFANYIDTSVF